MSRLDRTCTASACANRVWARELCRKHYYRWHTHGDPERVIVHMSPSGAPAAFLQSIPATGEGCLTWPFATNGAGYGQINHGSGKHLVSRLICERTHGPAPSLAHVAAHTCGKGHEACVAPWHLVWKTPAENSADRLAHGTLVHGERCPHAKLTAEQVAEIRALAGSNSQAAIGERFGVSQSLVGMIIRHQRWRHVEGAA